MRTDCFLLSESSLHYPSFSVPFCNSQRTELQKLATFPKKRNNRLLILSKERSIKREEKKGHVNDSEISSKLSYAALE